jgi:hypothetical protein
VTRRDRCLIEHPRFEKSMMFIVSFQLNLRRTAHTTCEPLRQAPIIRSISSGEVASHHDRRIALRVVQATRNRHMGSAREKRMPRTRPSSSASRSVTANVSSLEWSSTMTHSQAIPGVVGETVERLREPGVERLEVASLVECRRDDRDRHRQALSTAVITCSCSSAVISWQSGSTTVVSNACSLLARPAGDRRLAPPLPPVFL